MMARENKSKVEAWLTQEEAEIVRRHMADAHFTTTASYTRVCVLAGLPARTLQVDTWLGELGILVNGLVCELREQPNAELEKLVRPLRTVIRALQTERAAGRVWEGGWG